MAAKKKAKRAKKGKKVKKAKRVKKAKKVAKRKSTARKKVAKKAAKKRVAKAKKKKVAKKKKKVARRGKAPAKRKTAKVAAAPAPMRPMGIPVAPAALNEERVGVVTHYYSHLSVAVIELDSGMLREGDTIHIKGHTSDFTQRVGSMEVNHMQVSEAWAGQSFGLKVIEHAREHDVVYRVKSP
jgi:putative protease